jgi:hypothetical protein
MSVGRQKPGSLRFVRFLPLSLCRSRSLSFSLAFSHLPFHLDELTRPTPRSPGQKTQRHPRHGPPLLLLLPLPEARLADVRLSPSLSFFPVFCAWSRRDKSTRGTAQLCCCCCCCRSSPKLVWRLFVSSLSVLFFLPAYCSKKPGAEDAKAPAARPSSAAAVAAAAPRSSFGGCSSLFLFFFFFFLLFVAVVCSANSRN